MATSKTERWCDHPFERRTQSGRDGITKRQSRLSIDSAPIHGVSRPIHDKLRIALIKVQDGSCRRTEETFSGLSDAWMIETYCCPQCAAVQLSPSPPNLIILDIIASKSSSTPYIRSLHAVMPESPIIVLNASNDATDVLLSLMAGASGYLVKPLSSEEILTAIRGTLSGIPALSGQIQKVLVESLRRATPYFFGLPLRKQQIVAGLLQNLSDKEIAESLGIGLGTVRTHIAGIFKKLGVHKRSDVLSQILKVDEMFCQRKDDGAPIHQLSR